MTDSVSSVWLIVSHVSAVWLLVKPKHVVTWDMKSVIGRQSIPKCGGEEEDPDRWGG